MKITKIQYLLCFLFVLSGCVKESEDDGGRIRIGDRLPELPAPLTELPILHADPDAPVTFDTRDLGGRKTLIYFLWVGCPECQDATPEVLGVWTQIEDRSDVQLVCIARGGTGNSASRQDAIDYWTPLAPSIAPTPMPPLFYDAERRVFDLFAERGVPRYYLADADGIVRWEQLGKASTAELMHQLN